LKGELLLSVPFSKSHVVLGIRLNASFGEVVEAGKLLAARYEILFVYYISIEPWVVLIDVLVYELWILVVQ